MSILLADDDSEFATLLSKYLELEGYSVHMALDESTMLAELERQNYELIILDLNFGPTDGLQLLKRLWDVGLKTPVIVLSGQPDYSDRIHSLNLGADDYITKPCLFGQVAARIKAILPRKSDPSLSVLRVEDLELDPAGALRRVRRGNNEIKLSTTEFALLEFLMRHAGETVSRQVLLKEIWGTQVTDSNLVDVYVNYLRKKIESFRDEKLIHTVRGTGYRLGRPGVATQVEAVLHRKSDPSLSVLRVEDLELDPADALRRVRRGNNEIKLSTTEFALLEFLMRHAGETVSQQELLKEVWGTQVTDNSLLDVYVNYLRKKIEPSGAEKLIHTVRGAGYRLGRHAQDETRKSDPSLSVLRVEDLELDPADALRRVRRGNNEIKLSTMEFALLEFLMRRAGETVSRKELLKEVWGTQETESNFVDVYINYLRKKVDSFGDEKLIHKVGAGYRLGRHAPDESA